jgi:hypothetical protein
MSVAGCARDWHPAAPGKHPSVVELSARGRQDWPLCTSGDLNWTADREIPPTETPPPTVSDRVGVQLRVRHGVAEVVKLVEP